jgi:hypothetical protein
MMVNIEKRKEWLEKNREYLREYDRKHSLQYYQKNRERLKEKQKKYYYEIIKKNPERYALFIKNCKKWKHNNPEKYKEHTKKYNIMHQDKKKKHYIENKEKYIQKAYEWHKNNKEKFKKIVKKYEKTEKGIKSSNKRRLKRRAKINKVIHAFSVDEWIAKKNATQGYCPMCNKFVGTEKLSLDHIFPLSKAKEGRVYTINDIQPACVPCNSRKRDMR